MSKGYGRVKVTYLVLVPQIQRKKEKKYRAGAGDVKYNFSAQG